MERPSEACDFTDGKGDPAGAFLVIKDGQAGIALVV
jgi:hypothetical protein